MAGGGLFANALPAGWVLQDLANGKSCVPQRLARAVSPGWFDPEQAGATPVAEGGRQAAWFVDGPFGSAVLRHYRRGGLRARVGSDESYFWLGRRRVRALAEARVLAYLREAGLLVPEPLGAAWWRQGLMYRNAILVARIPRAQPLMNRLDQVDPGTVAQAICAMHDAGVWHKDLNAYNILLDEHSRVWLIDFDRAQRRTVSDAMRCQNLLRLRRSLAKVRGDHGKRWWARLMADGRFAHLR